MTKASKADEISLKALERRWSSWLSELPEPTAAQMARGRELMEEREAVRQAAVARRNASGGESKLSG